MWESDGSGVVGDNVRDLVLSDELLGDLAKFEAGLVSVDSVWHESSLDVLEDSEVLVGLLD